MVVAIEGPAVQVVRISETKVVDRCQRVYGMPGAGRRQVEKQQVDGRVHAWGGARCRRVLISGACIRYQVPESTICVLIHKQVNIYPLLFQIPTK